MRLGRQRVVGDLEAQGADHLPGFGDHAHLPTAHRVGGEVLLVGPGAVALVAAAVDVQGATPYCMSGPSGPLRLHRSPAWGDCDGVVSN